MLGTVTYNQPQLLSILNTRPQGNGLVNLARQLIAAKLNQAVGAPVPAEVQDAIVEADALIGDLVVPPVGDGYIRPRDTNGLMRLLRDYNDGEYPGGPPGCVEEGEEESTPLTGSDRPADKRASLIDDRT
jgi:hypothetical protein